MKHLFNIFKRKKKDGWTDFQDTRIPPQPVDLWGLSDMIEKDPYGAAYAEWKASGKYPKALKMFEKKVSDHKTQVGKWADKVVKPEAARMKVLADE